MARGERFELELIEAREIAPSVKHLRMQRADGEEIDFRPGQFFMFHVLDDEGTEVQRSYSVAAPPSPEGTVEFSVSLVRGGVGSRRIDAMAPGDTVPATGPFGRFILRPERPERYVLCATGTGVGPYRSMVPELRRRIREEGADVVLILGVPRRASLLYEKEWLQLSKESDGFEFLAVYDEDQPSAPEPWERAGYVHDLFPEVQLDPEQDLVYLCGNPMMIEAGLAELRARDFPTHRIRREVYESPDKPRS